MSTSESQNSTPDQKVREPGVDLTITDAIPIPISVLAADGKVLYINPVALEMVGVSLEEVKREGHLGLTCHPDDLDRVLDNRRMGLSKGVPFELEMRLLKHGEYRWNLVQYNPLRDESGNPIRWYVTAIDIEDRKRAEETLRATEFSWRQAVDSIPGFIWQLSAAGEVEVANRQILEYFGRDFEEIKNWTTSGILHPEDLPHAIEVSRRSFATGDPYELEIRARRFDGVYRWFQVRGQPVCDAKGRILHWYCLSTDIDDRKRAEEKLRQSEADFRSIIDNIPGFVCTSSPTGEAEFYNHQILEYYGKTSAELKDWDWSLTDVVHPDDLPRVIEAWRKSIGTGQIYEIEHRCRRADGVYRWFQVRGLPVRNAEDTIAAWYLLLTDIDDLKRAEQELRVTEFFLRETVDSIPGLVVQFSAAGEVEIINRQFLAYFGKSFEDIKNWATSGIVHPEDIPHTTEVLNNSFATGNPYELEARIRRFDGVYRWFHGRGVPVRDAEGRIRKWYALHTDIDDQKRAEQKLRQSEQELLTITDSIANPIAVLAPDGAMLYANRVALNHSGLSLSEAKEGFYPRSCHPDDIERAQDERLKGLREGVPFELEMRLLKYGKHRWHLTQYNPLKDERGHIIRWYVTATDIDDQKRTEEGLRNENLVLREEIDRSSMFEEIVGSSKPVRQVLKHVEKVASSDSTVLILGETGTGKELIARALHRRSKRSNRVFIRVNCAAIPQSLIASELFGHEKGAFTGALQRRVGRFEAANGGTLFLDEIGELPMETQIALLRVLQEKEFERVGSNHPISVDVRLIAATNRDLPAAVAAGTFRQDLFFRLNVFPISVPSLRERVDDIPLLVEYFVGRFAKEAGKNIRHIGKDTLEQLKSYHWPGNIRELQNVVERAVILSETDTFVVDESWLQSVSAESSPTRGLSMLDDREVEMIEAALAETHGRISGPTGAAAKLGIPRQTLESKIRRLGIDKYGRKRPTA